MTMIKKVIPVVASIFTIALINIIAAIIQNTHFDIATSNGENEIQLFNDKYLLIQKIIIVTLSCAVGGAIIGLFKKGNKTCVAVTSVLMFIIIGNWIRFGEPFWFWLVLILVIYPGIRIGQVFILCFLSKENKTAI